MHIPPYDNKNEPLVPAGGPVVPLNYFNIVKLSEGEAFSYAVPGFETCIVPATGTVDVSACGKEFRSLGNRGTDVWDGEPEGAYVSRGGAAEFRCVSESAEVFVAGAKCDDRFEPFAVRADDLDIVQYGSDDTKTHRKIKHILGQKQQGRVGRLLVSELFTVGTGGWSGFPSHKHDDDRTPAETRHDETYNFRFKPNRGSGLQLLQNGDEEPGDAFHVVDGSTFCIGKGYHPCVALPGYEMYYFTILGGYSQRGLIQHFQPAHADQVHTIPGIADMIAKFK